MRERTHKWYGFDGSPPRRLGLKPSHLGCEKGILPAQRDKHSIVESALIEQP
ncbi:MAG: hypothetical protein WCJ13_08325 [Coriobacteriia bacterium]